MLLLDRKLNEKIMIGDDIVITVMKITHHTASLGIEAPREVSVHREEVKERIQRGEPRR